MNQICDYIDCKKSPISTQEYNRIITEKSSYKSIDKTVSFCYEHTIEMHEIWKVYKNKSVFNGYIGLISCYSDDEIEWFISHRYITNEILKYFRDNLEIIILYRNKYMNNLKEDSRGKGHLYMINKLEMILYIINEKIEKQDNSIWFYYKGRRKIKVKKDQNNTNSINS
jgi:hypothetical protein